MSGTLEQRISNLDRENKARKALYPIAGSMVKYVTQTSQTFTHTTATFNDIIQIKFQPDKVDTNGRSLTEVVPQISISSDFSTPKSRVAYTNLPQTGDGSIILKAELSANSGVLFYIRAVARGTSAGTFTKL